MDSELVVLLIEDNEVDSSFVTAVIAKASGGRIATHCVSDLRSGIEALQTRRFDAVLLDLLLPDSQGLDTVAGLRKARADVPIVVLTATSDTTAGANALRQGAQDYMVKGQIDGPRLVRSIEYAIERHQFEKDRLAMQEQILESQNRESISRLACGMAHDLNNRLTSIMGTLELAMRRLPPDDAVRPMLESVHRSSVRASDLIRQLLLFGRAQPMRAQHLDLNGLVLGLRPAIMHLLGGDAHVDLRLCSDNLCARGDRANLEQSILSLVTCVRDLMVGDGAITLATDPIPKGSILMDPKEDAEAREFVSISISSSSGSLSEQEISHILEPFFSFGRNGKGYGMGLASADGIIREHGGSLHVRNEPGQGVTCTAILPACPPEEGHVASAGDALQGHGDRILVVEDDDEVREFMADALRENGYVVLCAANVSNALRIFEEERDRLKLAFVDVDLPDGPGLELVDQLRSRNPGLSVIMTSGHVDERSERPTMAMKEIEFLGKPHGYADLLKRVQAALHAD